MISKQRLAVYVYNIEPQRNESQAIIWGKTLVFDNRAELTSAEIDPEKYQF